MSQMDAKPVRSLLIVGGGLGGLALAQALRNTNIQITIFERDADAGSRHQGYVLGINEKGEEVLLKLQMPALTEFINGPESKRYRSFSLCDSDYKILMQFPAGKGKGCLIDRWQLRDMLMRGIGEGEAQNIKLVWGKKFASYSETENGVEVTFEDGSTVTGDVLVGADGSRSRVREQRTKEIVYEQLQVANLGAFAVAPPRPALEKFQDTISSCLLRAFGTDGVSLLAMPFISREDGMIVYALTFPCDPAVLQQQDIKPLLLERAAKVNPDAVELIRMTPPENFLSNRAVHSCRLLNNNPLGKTTRVTLLGDAAHAMTTHMGLGGNTALLDAIDLAKALSAPNWHTELANYEKVMIKRGYENVNMSKSSTERITKQNSELGASVRNWMMWTIGRFVGGEAKDV